ncbi:MAG: zinc ribbon domain-containing protein, partial [Bradymonadaceae bacterium]
MIVCDECGRENEDDYKFCLGCGHELSGGDGPEEDDEGESEEVACAYCGTRQPASFKFCGSCGERIPDEPEDPSEGKPARKTEETGGTGVPGGGAADDQSMPSPAPEQAAERVEEEGTAQAQLVVIQPDGTEGAAIEVRGDELEIGRASHFESLADDPFLSPHHATLVHRDGEYWLRDEDSVNGIFREVTDAVELGDHEFIRLGQELIEFE